MGKKIWYSTPLKFYWDELYGIQRKHTPKFTDERIFEVLRHNLITTPLKTDETLESRELIVSGWELWREDQRGELLHIFFLEKELQDFLEKTPLSDLDGIRQYLYQNGKNKTVLYFKTNGKSNCVVYTFGLHIPYEKDGYAFSLSLFEDNSIELYYCRGDYSGRVSDKFYKDLNRKEDHMSLVLSKVFRLVINTIAYMKCFPECVTEGVPKITKERNEDRSENNIIFQMSEKIIDSGLEQRSKTPHFRKGFFKMLRSDYFTHKKGQIVYVTETMVKGKAKTVSTSEQIEEFAAKNENGNK